MTILELREIFKDRSGDINMLDPDIDRYLNSGVELLDLLTTYSHAPAKYYGELSIGDSFHNFGSKSRVIKEVWILDNEGKRTKLEKVVYADLIEQYPDPSEVDAGKPLYYAMNINRAFPTTFDETTLPAAFQPFIDTVAADYSIDGVIFRPPTDVVYVLEVIGKFHSPVLTLAYPNNWWGVNYPDLLILAAMYQLETHYRNMEGANGYMDTMATIIKGITYDSAEEEAVDYRIMRG